MLQSLLKTTSCRASFLTLLLAAFSFGLSAQVVQSDATLTACTDFQDGDIYTDSGGAGGSYTSNELTTLELCATAGETVSVTFTSFDVEASTISSCFDNLTVAGATAGDATYSGDANDAGAGLTCTDATDAAGNPTLGPFTSAAGGCLSFTFDSDSSVTQAGWEATISLSAACDGGGGDEPQEIAQAAATLTACTDFQDGDIYTDSGGAGGSYASNELSTLELCATAGETVTVTFTSFDVEASTFSSCFDNLTVAGAVAGDGTYAGDASDGGADLTCTDATDDNGDPTLGPFTSAAGGCLSFTFDSDSSVTQAGWEATISLSAACDDGGGDDCVADFDCEDSINVSLDEDANATITVDDLVLDGAEFCPGDQVTISQSSFGCTDIGETVVTLVVNDDFDPTNDTDVDPGTGEQRCQVTVVVDGDDVPDANLACLGRINLTLNDECQGLVIPEMVLTGDRECLDFSNLEVVVQDSDPSNGPIVDGCGEFTYTVRVLTGVGTTNGFVDEFDGGNWTVTDNANANGDEQQLASATFTPSTLTMSTTGSPFGIGGGTDFELSASIMFSYAATVSFDYDLNGVDEFFDEAIIVYDFEGTTIEEVINTSSPVSGSSSVDVQAGYTLEFRIEDDGLQPIGDIEETVLTITNFVVRGGGLVVGDRFGFTNCWGTVNAEDKTPPAVDFNPGDLTLLCVDFENDQNNVATLPASVNKCYRVNSSDGSVVFVNGVSTMAPALRARLLAGGLTPRVPLFTDGCTQFLEVCVSDAVAFGEDPACDDIVLTRTFTASEIVVCQPASGEGNAPTVATYQITFERPTLDDLEDENIEEVVYYEQCGTANPTRADYPAPRPGDFPFLQVGDRIFRLSAGAAVCNIGVTFSDGDPIVTCPFTYKFVRTYTVIDWCDPSDVRTFTQVVKVGDTIEPDFTGPNVETNANGDLVYGTNAGNICAAYIRLDDVTAVDNCSGTNVTITAEIFPGGLDNVAPIGAFTVVPGGAPELSTAIPAGRHLLRYTTADQCGNVSIDDFFFVVEDQTPPVAICEDGLNISIAGGANNGFAVLTPSNIDNGSYDDCSGVSLSIARVNSADLPIGVYGPQITLTCADIGIVRVGLRVEDALGNVNFCWLDVLVEDKLRPTCVAPANTTITCTEYNTTLPADIQDATDAQLDAIFGAAVGVDNCGTTITQSISGDVNSCGVGTFTRTFVSTDDAGFTNVGACTQRIDVIGIHDYRLTFPTDESGDCADIPEYAGVGAEELACDLITTTTKVDTLRTLLAGDECFKLRITYDVVNWCEYNTLGDPFIVTRDGSGVNNRQRQPRNIEEDVLYVNVIPNNTAGTGDDQAFMTLFTDRALNPTAPQRDQEFFGYAGSDSRGFFRYTQFIKIYDEVAPEITFTELEECFAGSGEGCRTTVTIEFTALDECSDAVVGVELDADYVEAAGFNPDNAAALGIGVSVENDGNGNYTVTATNVPVGEHALRVRASDGCGNFDVQIIEFCVTADRTPTPICIQTLTVVLMDDGNGGGTAAIWASDFIASPIQDCFGNEVTKYSLYRSSVASENGFVPVVSPATLGIDDIDCDDFEAGTVSVRVYAFDDNGSTPDYCEVVVEVQDNMGWCDGSSGDLSGFIGNDNDEMMSDVEVNLTGANGMDEMAMTSANGAFNFSNLPLGADYTVQPAYDAPVNLLEVKSSDMVDIIGEILGTTQFDSPYDYVAADVNGDREVSIFDVLEISQIILGQREVFSIGTNWVFVSADAQINMNNPYSVAFPQVYNVNDLAGSLRNVDFVASELGNTFNLAGRSAQRLNADDAQLEAGQTHTLVLDGSALAAFQGTIELAAGLELVAADYTGEGAINLDRAAEGLIAVALRDNATLSLEVRATEAGQLSELVSLTDAITVREGVTAAGISNALALNFSGVVAAELVNSLEQNAPNPVADVTTIAYTLAAAGQVTLNIQDVQGRTIMVRELEGVAGRNVTTVNVNELGAATGVLSYTLTAGDFSATKKMVVVR